MKYKVKFNYLLKTKQTFNIQIHVIFKNEIIHFGKIFGIIFIQLSEILFLKIYAEHIHRFLLIKKKIEEELPIQ